MDLSTFTDTPSTLDTFGIPDGDFAGTFGTRDIRGGYGLIALTPPEEHAMPLTEPELEENVRFFRITSPKHEIAGTRPYVKINLDRGLVYFLSPKLRELGIDRPVFESRGVKLTYLNIMRCFTQK